MAFTDAQKAKTIFHLNYPAENWALTTVSNALDAIADLSADLETEVVAIITELDAIDTQRKAYTPDAGVQVKTTGQVYYFRGVQRDLDVSYRHWQGKLASMLQLQVYSTVDSFGFSSARLKIG